MSAEILAVHPVLMSRDVEAAIVFYNRLGFHEVFRDRFAAPRYAVINRGHVELHLQWADASQWAHDADRPAYRFPSRDIDALHAEFAAAGARSAGAQGPYAMPSDTPWGTREFHMRDESGNVLQFYAPLATVSTPR